MYDCSGRVYSANKSSKLDHYILKHWVFCFCIAAVVAEFTLQNNPMKNFRKNLRLENYDYTNNGAYFITICTNFKKGLIGTKEEEILRQELLSLERRFAGIKIDWYVIMKSHVHIIIFLDNSNKGLPGIIQGFKSITNLRMKSLGHKTPFWQRNYYEHVVRNENALTKIREYIQNNPLADKLKIEKIYNHKVEQARPLQKSVVAEFTLQISRAPTTKMADLRKDLFLRNME